jgi:hypothetical protein
MSEFRRLDFVEEGALSHSSLEDYLTALNPEDPDEVFLNYYDVSKDGEIQHR